MQKKDNNKAVAMVLKSVLVIVILTVVSTAQAQNRDVMSAYQRNMQPLLEKIVGAPTDNERYNANELFVQMFDEALHVEESFHWKWNFGSTVSILTSSDRQFRIITWPVVRDNGEYECFGFVQSYNAKTEQYDVYQLHDKSDELISTDEVVLDPDNWLGSVYQELIETKYEGKISYTLIGWTGVNALIQRKVIEPILFRSNSSRPQFGQALFRREKNLRRVVFEYSRNAMVNVRFDEQTIRTYENKKVKKKGRTINVQVPHEEKAKMIIFDEIAPMLPGMEGLPQYYVPTGTEMAYIFLNGRWELRDNAQGRLSDPKLNKEFEPIHKDAPAYDMNR
ncbi:MAG: hypothetical protein J6X58_07450 [Bacteroidales bacterium]|nr:hypothetical protein [Bacteroidales bacterium]